AFNMLAGQVNQPIIRTAQLWQDFQQFRISMRRLGDILTAKPEVERGTTPENLPALQGDIEFRNVTFRYNPEGAEILRNVSFKIDAGQTIGIVGPSGSGKTTLTKLIQKMFTPSSGSVMVDGFDIALLNPSWLRRQVGTVLQENVLFNATVAENIAMSNPAMPMNDIIAASQISGAHDFITKLPMAYDTFLDERGGNLSGGQRQKIAIARTLAAKPRILILDEPTAALDYDSERIFQRNLGLITQNVTTVIIAHRLSTIRHADVILVMEDGELKDQGTHETLLQSSELYARLNAYG
ncbi:MAG: ATP-binding cassette domain-containing protein, partial [Pseudomonadota bacterium]